MDQAEKGSSGVDNVEALCKGEKKEGKKPKNLIPYKEDCL